MCKSQSHPWGPAGARASTVSLELVAGKAGRTEEGGVMGELGGDFLGGTQGDGGPFGIRGCSGVWSGFGSVR